MSSEVVSSEAVLAKLDEEVESHFWDSIAATAAHGATALDIMRPDWFWHVSRDQLDLGDCDKCIVGQLMGRYDQHETAFAQAIIRAVSPEAPLPHRFDEVDAVLADHGMLVLESRVPRGKMARAYEHLRHFWVQEIDERRTAEHGRPLPLRGLRLFLGYNPAQVPVLDLAT